MKFNVPTPSDLANYSQICQLIPGALTFLNHVEVKLGSRAVFEVKNDHDHTNIQLWLASAAKTTHNMAIESLIRSIDAPMQLNNKSIDITLVQKKAA